MRDYNQPTQAYSTWGDKLLQHCDRLQEIQVDRRFRPITLQLAPTEACDSDCSFCSVQSRPRGKITFSEIMCGLKQFADLGCKAVELTGGGNPTIYRDGDRTINHVIEACRMLGLQIGVITNSENLKRHLAKESFDSVSWIRVSLAKLDEGYSAEDYDLSGVPTGKLGLSYIVHAGTTPQTFREIEKVLANYPETKFVRIAADCLTEDSLIIRHKWGELVEKLDPRVFIKEIDDNFHPFPGGCWVGMLRPYWVSTGIYICTSHVLKKRTYLPEYRLCGPGDITSAWENMNTRFTQGLAPYEIDISQCWHCYYFNNNQILNTVIKEMPDKNFA